jgi:hypothetical protein
MINVFRIRPRGLNIGNALIDVATVSVLREAFGGPVNLVPVPATSSDEEGSIAGLTARSVHEMNLYGHGVVIGGGNLFENGRLDVDRAALRSLGPPMLLLGLSYGRIYDHRGRLTRRTDSMSDETIVALHRQATASLARDDATVAHLRGLGAPGVVLAGCPTVHALDVMGPSAAPTRDGVATLISVRNPDLMSVPVASQIRVRDDVRRLVELLEAEGRGPVQLLCHDKRDLTFAASVGDAEYLLPDDVWSYLRLLRSASLIVSFRLHASVPCLRFGTPVVNISYDERSLSLVRSLGLGEWDIDLVREEDVVPLVLDRVRRLPELESLVHDARPIWAELESATRSALERYAEDVMSYAAGAVRTAT